MSHFAVAVITDDKDKLDEILEPYWEELEVPKYIKYTKEQLIEKGKEEIQNYNKNTYKKYLANPEKYKSKCNNNRHIKYLEEEFPLKLNWTDEEIYQEQIQFENPENIGKNGEVYSNYNPKSKWDWYDIGGRFGSLLLTKSENNDTFEHNSFAEYFVGKDFNKSAPNGYKWVNGAKIKDIDFDKMNEVSTDYEEAIRFWELVVEEQPLKDGEEMPFNLYKKEYYIERYSNKENYAKVQSTFHTFALVDNEGWHEKGEMGWFAIDTSTKDSEEMFIKKFQEYINNSENQDKYIVIVDCHI